MVLQWFAGCAELHWPLSLCNSFPPSKSILKFHCWHAYRDSDLVQRIGAATALEVKASGIHYTFAPCVAVRNCNQLVLIGPAAFAK